MKICRYIHNHKINYGLILEEKVYLVPNIEKINQTDNGIDYSVSLNKSDVYFLPPTSPSKIVCVGRNYADHAAELGNKTPKEPLIFLKAPSSIITDGEVIKIPSQSDQVEHEGELGLVIGRNCKNLSENENPLHFILGYLCLNDITARDIQRSDVQFTRSKSFDTFCPIGKFIETQLDASNIRVVTKVNGIVKQDGRTFQMVFSIPFLIRYISSQMTLNIGDIIATGTPAGVSKLNPGDICEVEIEGVGNLRNTIED
jgi:2-keto-4-pentenoate hydratase/2-oxohepta-3-ene-1,7-dioic acid hydratase in catechol pathway